MAKKIPEAAPLTGSEAAIVIQDGKAVKTTTQNIANKAPPPAIPVKSVAGKTGDVTLTKADVGLGNVNNTADLNKPVSTATQQALDLKADKTQIPAVPVQSVNGKTGDVTVSKADVGLSAVNNTSDADKPVSTAQQTAIDKGKLRISRFTGTTNASGIAPITFTPAFGAIPDIDVIEAWSGEQMITGAVVPGSATVSGCQVQVMVSRGTLLLTSGPFQKAGSGVAITVRALGN
ncbi:hypothetical protein [Agrobacterium larrymoorei]|uniref:hypothetical protein n=1 Tax=Agrobacterium larrymoorei TaxID=160699 RepID=UPI0030BD6F81